MKLYHFCCDHSATAIAEDGVLRPHVQSVLGDRALIWLTDLEAPARSDIGLTSVILRCDRMRFRVTVDCEAHRWVDYARLLPKEIRVAARVLAAEAALPMQLVCHRRAGAGPRRGGAPMTPDTPVWISTPRAQIAYHRIGDRRTPCDGPREPPKFVSGVGHTWEI